MEQNSIQLSDTMCNKLDILLGDFGCLNAIDAACRWLFDDSAPIEDIYEIKAHSDGEYDENIEWLENYNI